ncbi:MAG: glycosyltransferase family 2 protein [Ignavibacteriae bacterium]|nr:glycosyltransferase family 2 protein [Ignavibacteriota bacterium]
MAIKNNIEVIIISYNSCKMTLDCIESIYNTKKGLDIGITVVDNASMDDTVFNVINKYPHVKIKSNESNLGYAAAVNAGAENIDADFIIVSNNDVIYHENAIEQLISYLDKNPDTAVTGPQQMYPDGSWEYSNGRLPGIILGLRNLFLITSIHQNLQRMKWKRKNSGMKPVNTGYIDGAVMAIKKNVFDQLNGFDKDYFFYTEEADFCKRVWDLGHKVKFIPDSIVTHVRGGSSARMGYDENKVRAFISSKFIYCNKHFSALRTRIYADLEIVHNYSMILFWKLINLFFAKGKKQYIHSKIKVYKVLARTWKEVFIKYLRNELIENNK